VSLSALLTDVDLSVRRASERLDMVGRIAVGHLYDLVGADEGGPGDRRRVSYAYFDVESHASPWALRLGRQSLHTGGVLGRFDGAHFTYDWREQRRVHVTAGYPVESTRRSLQTDRQFYGVAVDFDRWVGRWDVAPFVSLQTIDGVPDRRALGAEVRYLDGARSLTSMLDYDVDYGELNTALALGTWRLANRMTLTGLLDLRMSPVLTTRNALIGQPVTTIDELLVVLSEDGVMQLARDRTAQSRTATFGIATPVAERLQINADITVTKIGATVESFGVHAVPGTGVQTYYSTSLVASSLFGGGDVSVFNVRYGDSDEFTTAQLAWDLRFPVGRRLRVNPRLRLAFWESVATGRRRETITPSLRLLMTAARRYRFELEVGRGQLERTEGTSVQESVGSFFNLGYRMDF
jgi:hypothetical protein